MALPPTALAGLRPVPDIDAPKAAPSPDAQQGDEQGNWPEWLDYHDGTERCDACQYMQGDGSCPNVKMQVDPAGHCEAYEGKQEEQQPDQSQAGPPEEEQSEYPQ